MPVGEQCHGQAATNADRGRHRSTSWPSAIRNGLSPNRAAHDLTNAGIVGVMVGKGMAYRIVAFPDFENTGSRTAGRRLHCSHGDVGRWRDRLDRIESSLAIGQLPSRYAMALDARDLDALVALFVDDVDAGADGRGRDALKRWYDGVLRRFYRSIHLICGHAVRLRRRRPRDRVDILPRRTRGRRRVVRHHDAL